jgi:hypothetical protein
MRGKKAAKAIIRSIENQGMLSAGKMNIGDLETIWEKQQESDSPHF